MDDVFALIIFFCILFVGSSTVIAACWLLFIGFDWLFYFISSIPTPEWIEDV